jgi:hypothetical protein
VLSPYAKPGHISHQLNSPVSLLRFCQQTFNLPPLNLRDGGSNAYETIELPSPSTSVQEDVMDDASKEAVLEASRAVIGTVAPDELPLFPEISEAFFKAPPSVRRGRAWTRFFGMGAAEAELLIPIVLSALTQIALFLAEEVGKELAKKIAGVTASAIWEQVRRVLRREPSVITLQRAQLDEIHRLALLTARNFKVREAKARQLADALVERLNVPHTS